MISREPFPNCRSGGDRPRNRGQSGKWRAPVSLARGVGHEIIPDTHKNGCANEATTGLTLGLFVMLFQDVVFGW